MCPFILTCVLHAGDKKRQGVQPGERRRREELGRRWMSSMKEEGGMYSTRCCMKEGDKRRDGLLHGICGAFLDRLVGPTFHGLRLSFVIAVH